MPDIILPKRIPALVTRRRSVDAPTAANLPTINPAVARDPGLTVPDGAFGGGIGEGLETFGAALSEASEEVRQSIERQQRLRDATEEAKTKEELLTLLRDGLSKRATEADFADDAVRGEYNIFVGNSIVDSRQRYRSATGAARMSDEASTRLDRTLDDIGKIFIDQSDSLHLRSLEQRGIEQLTSLADQAAGQARNDPAIVPDEDPTLLLDIHLEMFEEAAAAFDGAFKGNREQDIRAAGRMKIIEQFLTGMAEAGRGGEAQALLKNENIAGSLDDITRTRLTRDTKALTEAHDQDRTAQTQRDTEAVAREIETKALTFNTGFRSRLAGGGATLAEIATAHNEGVLTTAQVDRLHADFTVEQQRRSKASARAERVSSKLQTANRLDPEDFDDHDDVAHHYAATLKPSLAELDPARKAAAIGGYVAETGIAPEAALNSLLALTATGDPANRIAAARELVAVFKTDPTARDRVPPSLATHAETMAQLADTGSILPEKIIEATNALFGASTPGPAGDQPNAPLIQLAAARTSATVQTDAQPDAQPEAASEKDVPPGVEAKQFRPDGRLRAGQNKTVEAVIEQEGNINRGGDESANTDPRSSARRVRDTLASATVSAVARNDAIDEKFPDPITSSDGLNKDPNKSQFGGGDLREMTTEDLKKRFASATAGLNNQARKLNEFNRSSMSAQDKEDPIREDLEQIREEIGLKIGFAEATSLLNLVKKRVLSVAALRDFVDVIPDLVNFQGRFADLKTAHKKTMEARSPEDAQRITVMRWLTEQRNIDAILKKRETEKHR
jgi:hypothetical protein